MNISYDKIINEPEELYQYTGLNADNFNQLVNEFRIEWEQYFNQYTMRGQLRHRKGRTRKNTVLPQIYDKLLFILIYLKTSPKQEKLASSFSMLQPQAYCWIQLLKSILKLTLTRLIEVEGHDNPQLITFSNQCTVVPAKNFQYCT